MRVRLLEAAEADLSEGARFYELRAPGLGSYFLESLDIDVRSLAISAGVHERYRGYYRKMARRFPFALYYLLDGVDVDVYAIIDCRRDPEWIAQRLSVLPRP